MEEKRSKIVFVKVTEKVNKNSCGPYVVGLIRDWSESNEHGQEYSVIGCGDSEVEALKQAVTRLEQAYGHIMDELKDFGSAVFEDGCVNDRCEVESVKRPFVYTDHEWNERHTTVSSIWVNNEGVAIWADL